MTSSGVTIGSPIAEVALEKREGTFWKQGSFIPTWRMRNFVLDDKGLVYMNAYSGTVTGVIAASRLQFCVVEQDRDYPKKGLYIKSTKENQLKDAVKLRVWFPNTTQKSEFENNVRCFIDHFRTNMF